MESDTSPQIMDAEGINEGQVSAAVLLIVGEPVSADHKTLILAEITKGFRCWGCPDVDLNDELAHIANAAELGVEGPNDNEGICERVLNYGSPKMATMVVINPHIETLTAALKNFLSLSAPYKHLVYAGHFFAGNGAWILQDDIFSVAKFAHLCKDKELEEAMKQQNGGQINFYFSKGGEWKAESLKKLDIFKNTVINVSPDDQLLDNVHGVLQFTAYVASFINAKTSEDLLRTSDVVGNIRFNKPTLYIFPGSEGDSALFGVSGFNLLINGGYSRKACFWDLTRHLDRIDSFLMTHLGTDNIFGISTLLKRKSTEYIYPEIGYMFLNGSDKVSHSAVVNGQAEKEPDLSINLSEEGSKLMEYAKQLGHIPQPCTRPSSSQPLQPINLYHKVGQGSLNMYVLNPVSDSKELKDFYQHWNKHLSDFGSMHQIPLQNQLSVCTLLVWQPADPNEKITRIFFPGNAPQYKILEGLEKIKHLDILKHVSCTAKDLGSKPATAASKRNSLAARPPPSKPLVKSNEPVKSSRPVSDVKKSSEIRSSVERKPVDVKASIERKKPEPKKDEPKSTQPPKPRVPTASSLASKGNKITKEDENKKLAKKEDKNKSLSKAAPAPSKAAPKSKAEPKPKKETPSKTPKEKPQEKVEERSVEKQVEQDVPKIEELPTKVEEPPVAVVEPMQEKPLLDLSPNEPQANNFISDATEEKQESPEPLPQLSDDDSQSNPSQEQDLMGMGSNMMESYHEGYNGDLMGNGTPTEEQGRNVNMGEYDNNVDVQPEALPEPVEYPVQQDSFSQPDMIPVNDRKSQEEKPLISGMAPIEPDVIQGLQSEEQGDFSTAQTSTPLDEKSMGFDMSEKSIISPDSESVDAKTQDPMQTSFYGDELGPEKESETFETMNKSDEQVQEKFEEEDVESKDKMQDTPGEFEEDEISSDDENDSQADIHEKNMEELEKDKMSPYAFENKAFQSGTDNQSIDEPPKCEIPEMQNSSEAPISEIQQEQDNVQASMEPKAQEQERTLEFPDPEVPKTETKSASESSDEGVEDDEDKCLDDLEEENLKQNNIGIRVDEHVIDDRDQQQFERFEDESAEQYNDSLEVSNIPEAFEKDETPDPREIQSSQALPEETVASKVLAEERPMESMDPYDPFCSTSPNASAQSSNPFGDFHGVGKTSESPVDKPLNGLGFDPYTQQKQNPFEGINNETGDYQTEENELKNNPFDPVAEWGKPMGLPSPPPPDASNKSSDKKSTPSKQANTAKSDTKPAANKTKGKLDTSLNGAPGKPNTTKTRPASATEPKARPATASKRPATATGASRSTPAVKTPPLPPFTPFYVDLTYIPNHGNPAYSDVEFFKRVRARYYVLSSLSPNPQTLTALMEAKETWDNKNTEVTLIPTYANDNLRHWMGLNRDKLNELNIDVAPSANRSTIHLQDHETSCSAYRLEF